MSKIKVDRVGEINHTKKGETIQIIKYEKANNIEVKFIDYDYVVKTTYSAFKEGKIKCPYTRSVYGVGYLGEDFYNYRNIRNLIEYQQWRNMLKRCYCESELKVHPEYSLVTVCEQWHNFSTYYKWRKENYYEIEGETMHLDKDILHKKTYQYSPENCVFVPQTINSIFEKSDRAKCKNRNDLPPGVLWIKPDNIYASRCRLGKNKSIWLGRSHDPMICFLRYKQCKENYIKQVADEYKGRIPDRLYNALYNYEVEIDD